MNDTKYRLEESARSTLDSSGTGSQLNVGPKLPGERWVIKTFSASGTAVAKLQIMRGNSFDATRQLAVTVRADNDTSPEDLELRAGEVISFWWTGGSSGASMVCSIVGERYVPGKRAY